MQHAPINPAIVQDVIDKLKLSDFSKATIREIVTIANAAETRTGKSTYVWKWVYLVLMPPKLVLNQKLKH